MKRINKLTLLLILLAALAFPTSVFAAGVNPTNPADKVVLGGTFDVTSGQTFDGNLACLGGTTTIEQNATVNGDIFQAGGTLTIDGKVNGNISALGGTIYLNKNAVVTGDVSTVGGTLHRDSGAQIQGEVVNGTQGPLTFTTPAPIYRPSIDFKPLTDILGFFLRTLLMTALALFVGLFLPNPLARTGKAIVSQPVVTAGMGLLTAVIAPVLLVLLAITLILIPISLIGFLALAVAVLFGTVALGLELGNRIADMFKTVWPPAVAASAGTFLLTLVLGGIDMIPCVGWIPTAIVWLFALGAVLLTRFGMISYPAPNSSVPPASSFYTFTPPARPTPTPAANPGEDNPPSVTPEQ